MHSWDLLSCKISSLLSSIANVWSRDGNRLYSGAIEPISAQLTNPLARRKFVLSSVRK